MIVLTFGSCTQSLFVIRYLLVVTFLTLETFWCFRLKIFCWQNSPITNSSGSWDSLAVFKCRSRYL